MRGVVGWPRLVGLVLAVRAGDRYAPALDTRPATIREPISPAE
jgi:hypothetical protein